MCSPRLLSRTNSPSPADHELWLNELATKLQHPQQQGLIQAPDLGFKETRLCRARNFNCTIGPVLHASGPNSTWPIKDSDDSADPNPGPGVGVGFGIGPGSGKRSCRLDYGTVDLAAHRHSKFTNVSSIDPIYCICLLCLHTQTHTSSYLTRLEHSVDDFQ